MWYFVCLAVSDVETALENSKLAILERLVLQILFVPSQLWWVRFGYLQKLKCRL